MKPPETSKIHDAEASVYQRYAAAAQATEPALCCPVEYAADFLTVIPDEIIERDDGCGDPTPFVQPELASCATLQPKSPVRRAA